ALPIGRTRGFKPRVRNNLIECEGSSMPLIKVKDLNFYYEFHGEGEPLVLISGTGFSCEHWKVFQVSDLCKHFRVLIWDHRGTGRSDKPELHYSTRMFAEDCANLMKALNIGKAHIMGHSMGGRVAQWVAIDHPECVATLILSGSGPGTAYDGQFYERGVPFDTIVELIEKGSEKYMRDHVAGDFMFSPEFVQKNPEVIKRFEKASLNYPTPMRPYLRHVIARQEHETRHLLHKIDCSTLVICGAGDRTEGGTGDHVQSSKALAGGIKGAEFIMVEGGKHGYIRQMPEKANPIFIDFLKHHSIKND
ncbi:MAG: alpha/beta hydrolase, partial [Candidatus Binatia bacterium]